MTQKDYSRYSKSQVIDDRFGEPDLEAWALFDAEQEKKVDPIRTLHLIHRTLGLSIEDARRKINRYTTVAYGSNDNALVRDAESNPHFYSEDKYFGKYYFDNPTLDENELDTIRRILYSPWGAYITQDMGTTPEQVLEIISKPLKRLRIVLKEGAVRNGYIPIPSDQGFFPKNYFGGSDESQEAVKFRLQLLGGDIIETDIRAPSGRGGRLRKRFNRLFRENNILPGQAIIFAETGPDSYILTLESEQSIPRTTGTRTMSDINLNQILYGPPGTGKTYATVNRALEILDPEFAHANANKRTLLRKRFEELSAQGRIEFVTFHQSFSYEDFVEGLRASSEDGKISYDVDDGVFKRICIMDQAVAEKSSKAQIDIGNRTIWKMSLGDTLGEDSFIYEHCIEQNEIRLGYGRGLDFSSAGDSKQIAEIYKHEDIEVKAQDYKVTSVNTFKNKISTGDLIVVSDGNKKFRAIAEVSGDYEFKPDENLMNYAQCRPVIWHKAWDRSLPYDQLLNKTFSQMTLYHLKPKVIRLEKLAELLGTINASESDRGEHLKIRAGMQLADGRYEITYTSGDIVRVLVKKTGSTVCFDMMLLEELERYVIEGQITIEDIKQKRVFDKTESTLEKYTVNGYPGLLAEIVNEMTAHDTAVPKYQTAPTRERVLIIDEINRGNIANIFGELITLIEPSKRAGAEEATEVTLPYSKEKFSVPSNVYIIGTMNTADRSLVHVDTALRRRFTFIETPPDLDVLTGIVVDGVDIRTLLETINNRIELIYDREHRIGHSYFLPLEKKPTIEKLASIFSDQVIPLLEEYFFDDWARIQQVLRNADGQTSSFVEPKFSDKEVQAILGEQSDQVGTVFKKSTAAMQNPSSYIGLYKSGRAE